MVKQVIFSYLLLFFLFKGLYTLVHGFTSKTLDDQSMATYLSSNLTLTAQSAETDRSHFILPPSPFGPRSFTSHDERMFPRGNPMLLFGVKFSKDLKLNLYLRSISKDSVKIVSFL